MTWVFVDKNVEPLPIIGAGPMTDEEFEERVARYEEGFPGQEGAVKASGLYKHYVRLPSEYREEPAADEAATDEEE